MILECIPDYQNIEEWAALAEEFGMNFEYNEFFRPDILSDPKKIDEIISLYHGLGRDTSDDTLHGAFYDINISSYDPLIRDASDYRVKQSIDIAEQLGVRGVVFHTNYLSDFKSEAYRSSWVESNILYWTDLCKKHPGVEVYLENMFDESPELLSKVANEMRYVRNFGVCLDLAHVFRYTTGLRRFPGKSATFTSMTTTACRICICPSEAAPWTGRFSRIRTFFGTTLPF